MQRFVSRERILRVDRIIQRFDLAHRIEHLLVVLVIGVLLLTGLPQKFAGWELSGTLIGWMGGINQVRLIHRVAALILIGEALYHALVLVYRFMVLRLPPSIAMLPRDFRDMWQMIRFRLKRTGEPPDMGRFTYQEKVLYWMVTWSVAILIASGLVLWKPTLVTRALPGEIIPAAKSAHGSEALLLAMVAVLWHSWHTLIRQRNLSIVTGSIAEETMLNEHPLEWDAIMKGIDRLPLDARAVHRRRMKFLPGAILLVVAVVAGLWLYLGSEPTAILTHDAPEVVDSDEPISPVHLPTAIPVSSDSSGLTWDETVGKYFGWRCGRCHGDGDEPDLTRYDTLMESGVIIPGRASASRVVIVQAGQDHGGMFTAEELVAVIDWINQGAPR